MVVELRPPTPDDVADVVEVINAVHRHDGVPYLLSVEEIEEWFTTDSIDPVHDLRVVVDDGTIVGWGEAMHRPSGERLERAFLDGGVLPSHRGRGIGRMLFPWQVERGTDHLLGTPDHLPAYLRLHVYDDEVDRPALLRRFGFAPVRYDHELARPLDDLPELPTVDGVTIRSWGDDDAEATRLVHNAAFADHWGSTPRSSELWVEDLGRMGTRVDLSVVAVDDASGEVVAYSLNERYPDDVEMSGRTEAWIGSLGTLRSHRRRGLASALIVHSLHRFAAEGIEAAVLGVDTENPSGAYGLYRRLGFDRRSGSATWERTVRDGDEPTA